MGRLIDADSLIKELVSNEIQPTKDIENYIEGWCEGYNTVVDIINEQPTAYDVDAVQEIRAKAIEEFKEKAFEMFTDFNMAHGCSTLGDCEDILYACAEQMKGGAE